MPGKKKRNNKKKKKQMQGNYLPTAAPGCHIAHFEADWLIDVQPFQAADFGLEEEDAVEGKFPDISVDPESFVLTVINLSYEHARAYYITVENGAEDAKGRPLTMGVNRNAEGKETKCITFILSVLPRYSMDVCVLKLDNGLDSLCLESDIQNITVHPDPLTFNPNFVFQFPLESSSTQPSFQCSQSACGMLSHFFRQTFHAVDFSCPIGTPVLAIGDGQVVDIKQENKAAGIHIRNLFHWNSIMLKLDVGGYVEYVHIKDNSVIVKVGDKVIKGQKLCLSGQVGFCPTPHLHIQMQESKSDTAPTIRFAFQKKTGEHYFPEAGKNYNIDGQV